MLNLITTQPSACVGITGRKKEKIYRDTIEIHNSFNCMIKHDLTKALQPANNHLNWYNLAKNRTQRNHRHAEKKNRGNVEQKSSLWNGDFLVRVFYLFTWCCKRLLPTHTWLFMDKYEKGTEVQIHILLMTPCQWQEILDTMKRIRRAYTTQERIRTLKIQYFIRTQVHNALINNCRLTLHGW